METLNTTNRDAEEPEPYRHKTRAELIQWIRSLQIESARYRRGKRYWKEYAKKLEETMHSVE